MRHLKLGFPERRLIVADTISTAESIINLCADHGYYGTDDLPSHSYPHYRPLATEAMTYAINAISPQREQKYVRTHRRCVAHQRIQHPLKSHALFLYAMLFKYLVDVGGAFST